MYTHKTIRFKSILKIMGFHLIWLTVWASLVALVFHYTRWRWMVIPWVPVSLIGTAVAFYVGFKNNQAYDRLWEGRKIWGGIVNSSRSFGSALLGFLKEKAIPETSKVIVYRHIAWLYQLRAQLLEPMPWEHASQNDPIGIVNRQRMKTTGIGILDPDLTSKALHQHLTPADFAKLQQIRGNKAMQLMHKQAESLTELLEKGHLSAFHHVHLQQLLNELVTQQGMAERIKKFPLPRQYASASFIFVVIFILFLPLGMVNEFDKLGEWGIWVSIPFCVIVGWVYVFMELVGDYSENPFEGLSSDVPMFSIARGIEIDLKEMLGETELPEPVKAVNDVLL